MIFSCHDNNYSEQLFHLQVLGLDRLVLEEFIEAKLRTGGEGHKFLFFLRENVFREIFQLLLLPGFIQKTDSKFLLPDDSVGEKIVEIAGDNFIGIHAELTRFPGLRF